ncbi:MAG TPA: putative baseplate assembly protein, partial [Solibacterales bacterium]|nr:putative baseplate assembly protein [Bryobacterales bacterium]
MADRYFCKSRGRRDAVRNTLDGGGNPVLNGIDFLEVLADHRTLEVHFIHPVTAALSLQNFAVLGGVRIRGIEIDTVSPPAGNVVTVTPSASGDFSIYTLRLQTSDTDSGVPAGFDAELASVAFSFKVDCPSDFDCKTVVECPPQALDEPAIDYQAKDYASFRALMLERLAVTMPGWRERSPADLQVTLVELLAYVGDQISYHQDAVATEAYLGTARKRISVRRHARLLDYFMHEGANARAWVVFDFQGAGSAAARTVPAGTPVVSRGPDPGEVLIDPGDATRIRGLLSEEPIWYELVHSLTLDEAHTRIRFHTWDDSLCCLPAGATHATLVNDPPLSLAEGSYLLFEEVLGPTTGAPFDADPLHRHVVRLTRVEPRTDLLHDTPVLEVWWDATDALPFPLCLSAQVLDQDGRLRLVEDVSVARANVALADHGRTIPLEDLVPPRTPAEGNYRPVLRLGPLTFAPPFDSAQPVSAAAADPRSARPQVWIQGEGLLWSAGYDLLSTDRFRPEFVVEMDGEGFAHLRFGDDVQGRKPSPDTPFRASYRIGSGTAGLVGADVLTRLVWQPGAIAGLAIMLRNPQPAFGAADPEPLEQVRQFAPQAFRTQRRAVTQEDYEAAAEQNPEVQKAAARFRWTGSWYTVFVTVDRKGGLEVDRPFRDKIRNWLERFRLAGFDLEISAPVFV